MQNKSKLVFPEDQSKEPRACSKCGIVKPIEDFGLTMDKRRSNPKVRVLTHCKECGKQYLKKFHDKNPGYRKEINKKYRDGRDTAADAALRKFRYNNDPEYRTRIKGNAQRYKEKRPLYKRMLNLRSMYGMTLEEYDSMLARQGGVCAICGGKHAKNGTSKDTLHVDHCHKTGLVRGILCDFCNRGIGMFKDNPVLLMRTAYYLMNAQRKGNSNVQA